MERFNRTYRHEILDAFVFESLADVRDLTTAFLTNYNTQRPHDSLGRVPPLTSLPRRTAADSSSYQVSTRRGSLPPEHRRTAVTSAMTTAEVSERRACRYTGFARSTQRYQSRRPPDTELRARLHELAARRRR